MCKLDPVQLVISETTENLKQVQMICRDQVCADIECCCNRAGALDHAGGRGKACNRHLPDVSKTRRLITWHMSTT